jgi:hypothetical protein
MARPSHRGSVVAPIVTSLAVYMAAGCSSDHETSTWSEGGTSQAGSADDDDDSGNATGGGSLAQTGGSGTHVDTDTGGTHAGGSPSEAGTAQGGAPLPTGSGGGSAGSGGGSAGSAGTDLGPGWAGGGQAPTGTGKTIDCGGDGCQCNNGIDDDGDGQIDGFDTECVGPYDDDEGTFATGIPGDNSDPKWQDCFFDGNSGAGDDGCRYSTRCLTGELEPTDPDCTVTDACVEFCAPMTPNGCDCFGCCGVTDSKGVEHFVVVKGACSVETLDDPKVCIPCTPSDLCGNECGECELCPGKSPEDLPASCASPPDEGGAGAGGTGNTPPTAGAGGSTPEIPVYECDNGMPVCGPEIPCIEAQFCMNGCCMWYPL